MSREFNEIREEVKGLVGIKNSNPLSPACICDGCRYSGMCYGGRMRNSGGRDFCFIDMAQGGGVNGNY